MAEHGSDVFYHGEIAEAIEKATDGWIDRASLAAYDVYEREVIRGTYRGYEVIGAPPIVSGVRVQQTLNILENFDLTRFESDADPKFIHLITEALKVTHADFSAYIWDPNFFRAPIEGLLSKEYAAKRAALIDMDRAQNYPPGDPYEFIAASSDVVAMRETEESPSTTHFSVLDKDGNAVAVTQTISSLWGSRIVIPGYGFLMSNHFRQFPTFDPEDPFNPGYAAPLKTTRTNLSPTVIKQNGQVRLIVGTPGGARIPQGTVQVITSVLDFNQDLSSAVLAPKISVSNNNLVLNIEAGLTDEELARLAARGHDVRTVEAQYYSNFNVIYVEDDGTMHGVGAYRRTGGAAAPVGSNTE